MSAALPAAMDSSSTSRSETAARKEGGSAVRCTLAEIDRLS